MERHSSLKHDVAHKQRIKDMLRDAIRVLCQNTIAHNTHLSIEALIGITVDNGDDMFIVSIHELIDKQPQPVSAAATPQKNTGNAQRISTPKSHPSTPRSCQPTPRSRVKPAAAVAVNDLHDVEQESEYYHPDEVGDTNEFVGGGSIDHFADGDGATQYAEERYHNIGTPYGTAVIKQSTSVVTYNVGQNPFQGMALKQEAFPESITDSYDGQHAEAESQNFGEDGYGGMQDWKPNIGCGSAGGKRFNPYNRPFSHRGHAFGGGMRGRGGGGVAARKSRLGTSHINRTRKTVSRAGGTAGGWAAPAGGMLNAGEMAAEPVDEVANVTIYTCARCGAQLHNKQSFLRHKKSHEGIFYRCDGCGKMIGRADNLRAHRRRCAAALMREQGAGQSLEDYGAS